MFLIYSLIIIFTILIIYPIILAFFRINKNTIIEGRKFNNIEILYNSNGAPQFNGFLLTTSYSDDLVVSVAIALL